MLNNYSVLVDVLIKDEMDGKQQHERIILLGSTPRYLIEYAQFPDLPLAIKAKVIGKAHFDHGITARSIKKLPELLGSPKSVFRSSSRPDNTVVLVTFEKKGLTPIIIPIQKDVHIGRNRGEAYNLVASIYGKEGPNPEIKWEREGLLLWKC